MSLHVRPRGRVPMDARTSSVEVQRDGMQRNWPAYPFEPTVAFLALALPPEGGNPPFSLTMQDSPELRAPRSWRVRSVNPTPSLGRQPCSRDRDWSAGVSW